MLSRQFYFICNHGITPRIGLLVAIAVCLNTQVNFASDSLVYVLNTSLKLMVQINSKNWGVCNPQFDVDAPPPLLHDTRCEVPRSRPSLVMSCQPIQLLIKLNWQTDRAPENSGGDCRGGLRRGDFVPKHMLWGVPLTGILKSALRIFDLGGLNVGTVGCYGWGTGD